jgi:hypothetical protein
MLAVLTVCALVLPAFKLDAMTEFGVKQGLTAALSEASTDPSKIVVKKVDVDLTEMPHLDKVAKGPPTLWYTSVAGREHHRFIAYMSTILPKGSVMIDLGTSGGLSAYAASKNPDVQVYSFDFGANNLDRVGKVPNLKTVGMDVKKIMACTDLGQTSANCVNAKILLSSQFMMLDLGTNPSQPEGFEVKLLAWLRQMKYTGMLMRSNIYIDTAFREWWKNIKEGSDGVKRKHDLSEVGHSTGTGIIDFEGGLELEVGNAFTVSPPLPLPLIYLPLPLIITHPPHLVSPTIHPLPLHPRTPCLSTHSPLPSWLQVEDGFIEYAHTPYTMRHTLIHSYTHTLIHSHTHTPIHSYTHTPIHSYTHTLTHSYTHTLIHSYTHTLIHAYTHTLTHPYTHTLIHSYTHTLTHSYTHTLIHSYTHTLIHSYTHTLIHSYTHTLIHSHTHTLIHSYTHTLIHSHTHTLIHSYTHTLTHSYTIRHTGRGWFHRVCSHPIHYAPYLTTHTLTHPYTMRHTSPLIHSHPIHYAPYLTTHTLTPHTLCAIRWRTVS